VFAGRAGAERVVAVDWNTDAIANAMANASLHNLKNIIEVRVSDVFSAVGHSEKFDVITAVLPFMNRPARDVVESSIWDTDLRANRDFFHGVNDFLAPNGRIYMAQTNFGAINEVMQMAEAAHLSVTQIGEQSVPSEDSIFYAFEMTPLKHRN
jgi:release factor glutamine methyltransferase